jgi:CRP-like cAMP-binding protein
VGDLASLFQLTRQEVAELKPILWFVFLLEITPFAYGEGISILSSLFNFSFEDISHGFAHSWEKHREAIVFYLHIFHIVIWLTLFGTIFTMFVTTTLKDMVLLLSTGSLFEMISAVALLWYLLQLTWTVVSDIMTCFKYSGPSKSFRQFWLQHTQEVKETNFKEASDEKDAVTILQSVPPFNLLPPHLLSKVVKKTGYQTYKPFSFLCREGESDRDLYLIMSGKVGVFKRSKMGKYRKIVELSEGSVFGEVGFFTGSVRTADVRALTKVKVFRVHHDKQYQDFSLSDEKFQFLQDRLWLSQALQNSELFKDLPLEAHNLVLGAGRITQYKKDQIIIQENSSEGGFYILIEGIAKVSQDGKELRNLNRGDVFGEIGLLYNLPRTATVTAASEVKVLELAPQEFWKMLSDQLVLGCHIENIAISRLDDDALKKQTQSTKSKN